MTQQFHIIPPTEVLFVLDRLRSHGYTACLVGGCVRDGCLGKGAEDWDIAASSLPEETAAVFADCRVIGTGMQHGTVTVLAGGRSMEVTTFRKDGDYKDHRRPDAVYFVSDITEDLRRRDFTVNAMAWSPATGIIDPFGGQADLQAGILRAVGDAETRFEEDALRILRGLRFAAALGFAIEAGTRSAMEAKKHLLRHVSRERVFVELRKLLLGKKAAEVLVDSRGIWAVVLPEVAALTPEVWQKRCEKIQAAPLDLCCRLAALLETEEAARLALTALKTDKRTRERTGWLCAMAAAPLEPTRRTARRLLAAHPAADVRLLLAWRQEEELLELVRQTMAEDPCLSVDRLALSARDLMALGCRGPEIGKMQRYLLKAVIDEECANTKEDLLKKAAEI